MTFIIEESWPSSEAYQSQFLTAVNAMDHQAAEYKAAVCLLETRRVADARKSFDACPGRPGINGPVWRCFNYGSWLNPINSSSFRTR